MDADLVALGRDAAHLVGIKQRGDGGIEETRRNLLALEQAADARHRLAVAVLPLADAHRAFIGVTQRDGVVVGIEGNRHGAARTIGPCGGRQAAAGPRPADDAAPRAFLPLPGCALGMGRCGHVCLPVWDAKSRARGLRRQLAVVPRRIR
jgi:hypothetical protein